MPNHKSAEKRVRSDERKRIRNRLVKGKVKSALKQAVSALAGSLSDDEVKAAILNAEKALASAATKGVIKKGKASRLVSRLWRTFHNRSTQTQASA